MKRLILALPACMSVPAIGIAHGIGEHGGGETHHHTGTAEVLTGIGIIVIIAIAWAMLSRGKR